MRKSAELVAEKLASLGVIALLPSELPYQRTIEIADALLASPIEAVEVVNVGDSTASTVQALQKRAGDLMLVGVNRTDSAETLQQAIACGADFASSSADFHLPLVAQAKQHDFLYIPTVHAPGQTLIAGRAGCTLQKIRDDIDHEGLEGLMERTQGRVRYIVNQIPIEFVDAAIEGGATLVCVNDIYLDGQQPMGDIINRARAARRAWQAAVSATPS